MPNKNKKPMLNGFSVYMKEVKIILKMNGSGKLSVKELSEHALPLWNNLSESEQTRYNGIAKRQRLRKQELYQGQLASDGIPVKFLKENKKEQQRLIQLMKNDLKSLVSLMGVSDILNYKIYIVSFNVMIATDEGAYLPNEIGMVEYSIKEGITKEYHSFIDPGPIPYGYTGQAKEHALTHEIPIDYNYGQCDHKKIFKRICDFVGGKGKDKKVKVFCHAEQIKQTHSCLDWLRSKTQQEEDLFYVCDLSFLLLELKFVAGDPFPSSTQAEDALSNSSYDMANESRCAYHEEKDSRFCALNYSKKLCFILSDCLLEPFNVQIKPGQHLPIREENFVMLAYNPPVDKFKKETSHSFSSSGSRRSSVVELAREIVTIMPNYTSKFIDFNPSVTPEIDIKEIDFCDGSTSLSSCSSSLRGSTSSLSSRHSLGIPRQPKTDFKIVKK